MRHELAAFALGLTLASRAVHAVPQGTRHAARTSDWTQAASGACPALVGLEGPGLCAVGAAPLRSGVTNARVSALQGAELELALLVQWRADRRRDPNAPRPTTASLKLEGVRNVQTTEKRGRLYVLLRLDEPQVQALVDRAQ